MSTFTRPAVAAQYAYYHFGSNSDDLQADARDVHRISLDLRSRLPWEIYFLSRNYYQILKSEERGKEKRLSLRGDLFWNYQTYRINFGVTHLSQKRYDRFDTDISTTALRAVISKSFGRRLFLAGRVTYSTTNTDLTVLELEPSLTWIYRQVSLTSRYTLRKSDFGDGVSRTDHRFFITLTRYFAQRIRPFL
jgi:hypothetical protein